MELDGIPPSHCADTTGKVTLYAHFMFPKPPHIQWGGWPHTLRTCLSEVCDSGSNYGGECDGTLNPPLILEAKS